MAKAGVANRSVVVAVVKVLHWAADDLERMM